MGPSAPDRKCLPGSDQVLSQVDGDRRAGDGDVTVAGAVDLTADLDLGARHLPDLVYLGALAADDRADQLRGRTDAEDHTGVKKTRFAALDCSQYGNICGCCELKSFASVNRAAFSCFL